VGVNFSFREIFIFSKFAFGYGFFFNLYFPYSQFEPLRAMLANFLVDFYDIFLKKFFLSKFAFGGKHFGGRFGH